MRPFHKKCCALLVGVTVMGGLMPPMTTEAYTKQVQNAETVYVGLIRDGERSSLFNQDWKFHLGDESGAEAVDFNDSSWRTLNLPHDWSIEGDFTVEGEAESGFLLGGTGWYRKTFVVPEKYKDKELTINFDGVYMNSEVYVNGNLLGEHNYGYTAFAFDLTDYLICDGVTENVIAVKVKNPVPTSRWYSGSGIYRDVTLTVTDPIHVSHLGTTVTTPKVEEQKGGNVDVVVETVVENETDNAKDVKLKTTVVNSEDEAVSAPVEETKNIASNEKITFEQTAVVNNPSLWSVDDPNMYKVKNEVIVNEEVVDTYYTDFGFRYFNFDRDTGFSLNGEKMKLKGVSMHHDQGALGAASYYRAVERQMEIMKEMGVNAIRVTHNPASQVLLEICDRLGLLVINEAFDTWINSKNGNGNDFARYFNTPIEENNQIINGEAGMSWGEFEARTMVKTSKNNPSVIMWSIGNEVLEGIGGDQSTYPQIAQNIIDWIKKEDTTRPVTIGDNKSKGWHENAIAISDVVANNGGIVGFNYTTAGQANDLRNNKENWIVYGSETSSAVHSRGYYKTRNISDQSKADLQIPEFDNDSNKVGWGHSASAAWKDTIQHDYNAGEFIWTGFDYIGEPTPWNGTATGSVSGKGPAPKSSYFGIVDTAGFEKDVYYLYQSQWNDDVNTLHILPTWNEKDIPVSEDGNVQVDVFTDARKVELYLNDRLIDTKTSEEHTTEAGYKYYTFENDSFYPTFTVPYEAGTIMVKGYDEKGNLLENTKGRSSITTYGDIETVKLTADRSEISADGYDLSYVTVDLVDKDGNIASGANNKLNYTLEGNGKIVGLDNGNAADTDRYKPASDKSGSRSAFNGKALVIVQSTKDAGDMTLTVSGDGIESKSITIKTVNDAGDDKYLESYNIVKDYYVALEEKPVLPQSVTARYSDGSTATLNINWDKYNEEELKTPKVFKVTGKLESTDVTVVVNVHVVGNVASVENYSTFTYAGTTPTLPKTVKGYLENGEESEDFRVNWNIEGLDFSKENTTVLVPGTVEILDKSYEVQANVRVVPALKAARNLSRSGITGLSQSCTNVSDNLNSITNGVTNGGEDTQERWTNWKEKDLTNENGQPKGAYVQLDFDKAYNVKKLDLWLFKDNISARLPQKVEISYKNSEGNYEVVNHESTDFVPFTEGATTFTLNEAVNTDSIRVYMQQPEVGQCIGLTEVKVYEDGEEESIYDKADTPTLSQSPEETSDNLMSIINGVTDGGDNTQERWTNWRERDVAGEDGEPKGAYVQFDWKNKYDIEKLDLWLFTDNTSARIPKKVEISYLNEEGKYVPVKHTNTTEVSHRDGETTYFLDEVINTNSIRIYMQQPQLGNCIGLTEVKVYEYVQKESLKTNNTLTEIKIDGKALENFDPATNEYSIKLDTLPQSVEATANDNAAVTILPIHNNQSKIVVVSEDGKKNIYTVNYELPKPVEFTVTVNKTEGGSVAGEGVYDAGTEATLVATADEGYEFIGWFDAEGNELSKNTTYRFTVEGNTSIEARFKEKDSNPSVVDKTVLSKTIEYAEDVKANGAIENVDPSIAQEFEAALKNAKDVLANENATVAEVNAANDRLIEAIKMLDFKKGDKAQLEKLVGIVEALDESKYTEETWTALQRDFENAKKVIADENASENEVKDAFDKLFKSYSELMLKADKSNLQELINKANDIDTSKYTKESVKALNSKLDAAKAVLAKEDATQEEIDKASSELKSALDNLELLKGQGDGKLPQTGAAISRISVIVLAVVLLIVGGVLLVKKRKSVDK